MNHPIRKESVSDISEHLSTIPKAPSTLYVRGALPDKEAALLAVVGSRNYSEYGKSVCEDLISKLAPYNISIVSGLALGVDAISHKAALKAGLHTIAVPGSGLDDSVLYPRTHYNLAHDILESGGALLSEYEPDTHAATYTFPKRNRIMAGISHGVLIIEAAEKSGTLITARLALDFNREVFAVPGSIQSEGSKGPHQLIRDGATPVTDVSDILEGLGVPEIEKEETRMTLSKNETYIYSLLTKPQEREELLNEADMPIADAQSLLIAMELKGIIHEHAGKIHRA